MRARGTFPRATVNAFMNQFESLSCSTQREYEGENSQLLEKVVD